MSFFSCYFLVPKLSMRPIMDLCVLNGHMAQSPFTYATFKQLLECNQPGDWMTSIDLTDPYCHFPHHIMPVTTRHPSQQIPLLLGSYAMTTQLLEKRRMCLRTPMVSVLFNGDFQGWQPPVCPPRPLRSHLSGISLQTLCPIQC